MVPLYSSVLCISQNSGLAALVGVPKSQWLQYGRGSFLSYVMIQPYNSLGLMWLFCGVGSLRSISFITLPFPAYCPPWHLLVGKGQGEGRSLLFTNMSWELRTSLLTPHQLDLVHGHNQMQWEALIWAATCSAENLEEGERKHFRRHLTVFAKEYDFIILFKKNLEA